MTETDHGQPEGFARTESGADHIMNRPFTLFIVQHSHIDIGYTERQEVITEYQRRFIEQAVELALSPAQEDRDDDTKFRFMCEGFWAVERYLSNADDEGRARLVRALKNGSIELSAFYLHMAELLDEGHLRDALKPAADFARKEGVPLVSAMSLDVNGFSWALVDALHDAGIKYLSTSINTHHGGAPFRRPNVPFYWESPSGNRVLVWNGLTYHKANLLGIMPGFQYVGESGIPGMKMVGGGWVDVDDISIPESTLFPLVEGLRGIGYEYDFLPLMGSGLYTDNSPPADSYCDHIRAWNDKHGDQIVIRTINLTELFEHIERTIADIPVYRGDWNDWWTDGTISTPFETSLFRNAQRTKRTAERLDPQRRFVSDDELDRVSHELILYSEHTWGHSASLAKPADFKVQQLLARKGKYAIEADRLACAALDSVLEGRGQVTLTARRSFAFKVINPSTETRTSFAYLPLDYWEVPVTGGHVRIVDATGRAYEHVRGSHTIRGGEQLCIELELGPLEERTFVLEILGAPDDGQAESRNVSSNSFENELLRVEWDDARGIRSLVHLPSGASLLDSSGLAFGAPVYQLFEGADRGDYAGFGNSPRKVAVPSVALGSLKSVECTVSNHKFEKWLFDYEVAGAHSFTTEFTFYRSLPRFDVSVKLNKESVLDPEGMYVAFPLQVDAGIWHLDKAGAAIRPGIDQLPLTCMDYYSVQGGAALVGSGLGVAVSTLDAPMVQIGELRLWTFTEAVEPTGALYSWLTNNKWETNFKATCGGMYEFRYVFDIREEYTDPDAAITACQENNYDFIAIRTGAVLT